MAIINNLILNDNCPKFENINIEESAKKLYPDLPIDNKSSQTEMDIEADNITNLNIGLNDSFRFSFTSATISSFKNVVKIHSLFERRLFCVTQLAAIIPKNIELLTKHRTLLKQIHKENCVEIIQCIKMLENDFALFLNNLLVNESYQYHDFDIRTIQRYKKILVSLKQIINTKPYDML